MSDLLRAISILDKPDRYWNMKKPYFTPKGISLLQHNDLKPGNVLVSPKSASIIDFEYLDFININSKKINKNWGIICNHSDIMGIPSNLRNLEYRTLLPYLFELDKSKAQKVFREYLQQKSKYYERMNQNYIETTAQLSSLNPFYLLAKNFSTKGKLENIAQKQLIHAQVLKNPSEDVIRAEAMKIQISRYIYLLSTHSHGAKTEVNLSQIKNYIQNASKIFEEKSQILSGLQKEYFQDCANLLKSWKKIIPIIDERSMKKHLDYYRDISGVSDNAGAQNANQLIPTTFTDKLLPTLDKLVV